MKNFWSRAWNIWDVLQNGSARKYGVHIIGPAYAAVGKVNDIYRKVIYLKHKDEQVLMEIKQKTEKYIEANSGFRKLYIQMVTVKL